MQPSDRQTSPSFCLNPVFLKLWCLLCLNLLMVNHLHADSDKKTACFVDAKTAYAYLLTQHQPQATSDIPTSNTININSASEAELVTLKGIGSKKAQAIIDYRNTMGDFVSLDELTDVKGIGKKTLEKNRQRLSLD